MGELSWKTTLVPSLEILASVFFCFIVRGQTNRQIHRNTDAAKRLTPATVIDVSNYHSNETRWPKNNRYTPNFTRRELVSGFKISENQRSNATRTVSTYWEVDGGTWLAVVKGISSCCRRQKWSYLSLSTYVNCRPPCSRQRWGDWRDEEAKMSLGVTLYQRMTVQRSRNRCIHTYQARTIKHLRSSSSV